MVITEIIDKVYVHFPPCGGEIEQYYIIGSLETKFRCLKCDESWTEKFELV